MSNVYVTPGGSLCFNNVGRSGILIHGVVVLGMNWEEEAEIKLENLEMFGNG